MKAAFFALFSFAVSALATPIIAERQLETQANEIDQLTELVKLHTANISQSSPTSPPPNQQNLFHKHRTNHHRTNVDKTTTAVQDNPSTEQQNAAAAALAPDFEAITEALKAATTSVAKRGWASLVEARTGGGGGGGGGACPQDCLLIKIQLLVWEIACTLRFVIVKLGLGESTFSPPRPLSFLPITQYSVVFDETGLCG